ncbi:related to nucleoside hydrolase [Sporisorium reilianum f. sp. reilianum]|uniref:Related to nucleoside hydrolase n=1 Tax=Sporisorium reilianum f. sp. reilianum TaxID=72559 RepID=A0A2N8U8Q9_9BASI|nr:related to nucleoside hydrolase [Sporisorium reilianum f. sp. reilianum]
MKKDTPSSPSSSSPSLLRRLSQFVQPGQSSSAFQPRSKGPTESPSTPTATLPNNDASVKSLWLDCDPGHDDAMALLMAVHHPSLELLGVSTVAGNAGGRDTFLNAVRLMALYRADASIPVIRGSDCPLVKDVKVDVGIHGQGGLGGVQGLPSLSSPLCQHWLHPSHPKTSSPTAGPEPSLFLYTLSTILTERLDTGKPPIHLAVTGPMTNVALFIRCYPHLIKGIEQIVLMGGAAGVRGNRGPLAEFNILNDPEAAAIVFNTDIKVVMAGLNVTHQAIFTAELHDRLLSGGMRSASSRRHSRTALSPISPTQSPAASPFAASSELSSSAHSGPSDLQRMLSSTLTFFAKTYASEFGFTRGPPVHDMLAIAYIIDPTLFYRRVPSPGDVPNAAMYDADPHSNKDVHVTSASARSSKTRSVQDGNSLGLVSGGTGETSDVADAPAASVADAATPFLGTPPKRYRVDVECNDGLACGATVVDFWGDRVEHDGWGKGGRNVEVLENLDCPRMWDLFFQVVERAEAHIAACEPVRDVAAATQDSVNAQSSPDSPARSPTKAFATMRLDGDSAANGTK